MWVTPLKSQVYLLSTTAAIFAVTGAAFAVTAIASVAYLPQ